MDGVNPNITAISDGTHKVRIYESYHRKDPVLLEQSDAAPKDPKGVYAQIRSAPDLWSAAEAADVDLGQLKMHDILLLRQDVETVKTVSKFKEFKWDLNIGSDFRCCYLWGPSGYGKTEWATAQFNNPLFCSHIDNLKQFKPGQHDGIIFDDMSFAHIPRETAIAICDWDKPRQIHCRTSCAFIPPETKKIFLSNKPWDATFPGDEYNAILARFSHIIRLERPTFTCTGENPHARPKTKAFVFRGPRLLEPSELPTPKRLAHGFNPGPQQGHGTFGSHVSCIEVPGETYGILGTHGSRFPDTFTTDTSLLGAEGQRPLLRTSPAGVLRLGGIRLPGQHDLDGRRGPDDVLCNLHRTTGAVGGRLDRTQMATPSQEAELHMLANDRAISQASMSSTDDSHDTTQGHLGECLQLGTLADFDKDFLGDCDMLEMFDFN